MKAGPYCGYSLDEIIKIKQKEEKEIGKFFWGYGGVFCRPNILQTFISKAQSENEKVWVLFSETKSSYTTTTQDRFTEFSKDSNTWERLSDKVLLVGNIQKKHFAITANNLVKNEFDLNIANYATMTGIFPNTNKYLDTYFRYRVDKACGYYLPGINSNEREVHVNYIAELVEPFSTYIH